MTKEEKNKVIEIIQEIKKAMGKESLFRDLNRKDKVKVLKLIEPYEDEHFWIDNIIVWKYILSDSVVLEVIAMEESVEDFACEMQLHHIGKCDINEIIEEVESLPIINEEELMTIKELRELYPMDRFILKKNCREYCEAVNMDMKVKSYRKSRNEVYIEIYK